ncbi:hypothetical protein B566_EDAN005534 [Ephemera danica]|nr:hypothetical protein B566_EDAN005534 [Ephemera danica]
MGDFRAAPCRFVSSGVYTGDEKARKREGRDGWWWQQWEGRGVACHCQLAEGGQVLVQLSSPPGGANRERLLVCSQNAEQRQWHHQQQQQQRRHQRPRSFLNTYPLDHGTVMIGAWWAGEVSSRAGASRALCAACKQVLLIPAYRPVATLLYRNVGER